VVGDQDPFPEDLFLQGAAGDRVDAPGQAQVGWMFTGQVGGQDPGDPAGPGDRVDRSLYRGRGPAGVAAGQGGGQFGQGAGGLGRGLVEPGRLGGVQGR
jgi:hypothetical protein